MHKNTMRYHARIRARLCGYCKTPLTLEQNALCTPCGQKSLKSVKARQKKYRDAGLCSNGCGNSCFKISPYCEKHLFFHRTGMKPLPQLEKERAWVEWQTFKNSPSCQICHSANAGSSHGWMVDHGHELNVFRGFLCSGCNLGLGGFRDNPESLLSAISYLKKDIL